MVLQPSRRDVIGPPRRDPRDASNLAALVRHQGSYLRSLDPGIQGGRWRSLRPVPAAVASQLVGDDGSGGSAESVIGEDEDRLTLSSLNTQTWRLIADPVWETLVVRWHPGGGAGVEWKRGVHYTIEEDDNLVTITADSLAAAKAEVGDMFSAQYLRIDDLDDVADPATAMLRAGVAEYSSPALPHSVALPTGTQVGDLLVVAADNITVADSRLTFVGNNMWIGFATDLSAISIGGPISGIYWAVAVESLITNATGWTAAYATTEYVTDGSLSVGSVSNVSAAVIALTSTHATVDGSCGVPSGYGLGASSGNGKHSAQVGYWDNASVLGSSPDGPAGFHGGNGTGWATVVGLIGP